MLLYSYFKNDPMSGHSPQRHYNLINNIMTPFGRTPS